MGTSNCCGAPVYEETDMCSACKEHCTEVEVYCAHCEWEGKEKEVEWDGEYQEGCLVGAASCPKCGSENLEEL